MQLQDQMYFKNNLKEYNYLKENSWYFKYLNRGEKNYEDFVKEMKVKYKERTSDKINNALDNIDLISSVLDVFK